MEDKSTQTIFEFENKERITNCNNKSGYNGIRWHKRDRKWYVQITYCYKKIHIGVFSTIEEAKEAYNNFVKNMNENYNCSYKIHN